MESIEHMIADKVFIHSKMCLLVEVLQYMYGSYCANSPRGLTVTNSDFVVICVINNPVWCNKHLTILPPPPSPRRF